MLYIAQLVKNLPAMQETGVRFLGWEAPGEGTGNPLQYSCLENPHGQREGWQATVHRVARVGHNLATKPPNHHHITIYLFHTHRPMNRLQLFKTIYF